MNKVKSFSVGAAALFGVLVSSEASAETLAWYHFDDKDPGTVMAAGETVADEINAEATARAYAINSATLTDSADYAHLRPRFAQSAGPMVYDPVTGARTPNMASMRFVTEAGVMPGTSTTVDWLNGGCLRVDARTAEPKKSMTLEFFFCMKQKPFGNTFAPVVGKLRDANFTAEAWAVYVTSNGKLSLRMSNGSEAANAGTGGVGAFVADGGWHHLALVYKEGEPKAWVYVDYQRVYEMAVKSVADIFYGNSATADATPLYIGGYPMKNSSYGYRKFDGCIDEVRISDAALEPSQFLRLRDTDSDTITRLRFDSPIGITTATGSNPNLLLDIPCTMTNFAATACTGAGATETIRENMYSDAQTNAHSLALQKSGTATAFGKVTSLSHYSLDGKNPSDTFTTNQAFTVEGYFKVNGDFPTAAAADTRKETVFKWGGTPICGLTLQCSNDENVNLLYTYNHNNTWKGAYLYAVIDDEQWHHAATVYDPTVRQMRFYLDGRLLGSANSVVCRVADGSSLFLGCDQNLGTAFNGSLDEFRVTKRALRPDEFLCATSVKAAEGSTLALFDFEREGETANASAVNGELIGPAIVQKHRPDLEGDDAGKVPTYVKWPKGGLLLEGTNENQTAVANTKWLKIENGVWGVGDYSPLFEQKDFTVEFFATINDLKTTANIIRLSSGTTNLNGDPTWALYHNAGSTALQARIQVITNGVSTAKYSGTWNLGDKIYENRIHHYAFVVDQTTTPGTVTMTLYRDYTSLGTRTFTGYLDYATVPGGSTTGSGRNNRLVIGGTGSKDAQFFGSIDSVRYSKGVLAPDKFMRLQKLGFTLIMR